MTPAMEVWILNHWTSRELPAMIGKQILFLYHRETGRIENKQLC